MNSRGSEWSKWDLHVHTPFSALNNQFGSNFDEYVRELFNRAIKNDIKVIGITDYFLIKGYEKIITDYKNNDKKLEEVFKAEIAEDKDYIKKINAITLLPNIEFRLNQTVQINKNDKPSKDTKLQLHIIFDSSIPITKIEENFLCKISFDGDGSSTNGNSKKPCTESSLCELGNYLKSCQAEFAVESDLVAGMNGAAVSLDDITSVLKNGGTTFENKYLIFLAEDDITKINWGDQGHMIKKRIYTVSHGLFSSNNKSINWGLEESTKNEFGYYKACIWGSDAHSFEKMFNPDNSKQLWIKSNPTFDGLLQAVFSPEGRIFIGSMPQKLKTTEASLTKYIDRIEIKKKPDAVNSEEWFDADIKLNAGLVTIIGNKGSGKSALSDIIGFLCNSSNIDNDKASFLTKDKFRNEKKKYANDYSGKITWRDEHKVEFKNLNESQESSVQRAIYLPQKFIEDICNNINNKFQEEIDNVIFSYIDVSDRAKCNNLKEIITLKTEVIESEIKSLRVSLDNVNEKIIGLENKLTSIYKEKLEEKQKYLEDEITRYSNLKPKKIKKPDIDENTHLLIFRTHITEKIDKIEKIVTLTKDEIVKKDIEIQKIENILSKKDIFVQNFNTFKSEVSLLSEDINISEGEFILDLKIDFRKFDKKLLTLYEEKKLLKSNTTNNTKDEEILDFEFNSDKLDEYLDSKKNYYDKLFLLEKTLEKIDESNSREMQAYLDYLKEKDNVDKKLYELENGSDEEHGIIYYKKELSYLENELSNNIDECRKERLDISEKIYNCVKEEVNIYKAMYSPIKDQLELVLSDIDEGVEFSSDIVADNKLKDEILDKIVKRFEGNFKNIATSNSYMDKLIRETEFNNKDSVISFVNKIVNSINDKPDIIDSIIKDRKTFLNYLFGLSFLNVEYTLKLGHKNLKELSPGERGMLLLIFYLALDKTKDPLIIDQPEDNLDNQSVYNKLVPCILKAKTQRQVIIVTHNPNIAVACDSEQIICCSIDKIKNTIRYTSGSIEDAVIRNKIVEILEGTKPAFNLRKLKYVDNQINTIVS